MESAAAKKEIIKKLQNYILSLQGLKMPLDKRRAFGLGPLEAAFPHQTFPTGVIHEFISTTAEEASATLGFMAALLGKLMAGSGPCLWISGRRTLFPAALNYFGVDAGRIIFVDFSRQKDLLWIVEEALKCEMLSTVVTELDAIGFTESRRLQLAAESSRVTGLVHCYNATAIGNTTSVARWYITPLSSGGRPGMPGVGFPIWNIELARIRNGKPGAWKMEWVGGHFRPVRERQENMQVLLDKTA